VLHCQWGYTNLLHSEANLLQPVYMILQHLHYRWLQTITPKHDYTVTNTAHQVQLALIITLTRYYVTSILNLPQPFSWASGSDAKQTKSSLSLSQRTWGDHLGGLVPMALYGATHLLCVLLLLDCVGQCISLITFCLQDSMSMSKMSTSMASEINLHFPLLSSPDCLGI